MFAIVKFTVTGTELTAADDPGWKPVWSDEFDGEAFDYSKWEAEVNAFGDGNHELQLYTDRAENLCVDAGHLILEARRDRPAIHGTERNSSSGRLRSKHRGDWKYGRLEIRAKLPKGQGVWPAIRMMPADDVYGGGARSGENDIMEFKGQEPNVVQGSLPDEAAWPDNAHSETRSNGSPVTSPMIVTRSSWNGTSGRCAGLLTAGSGRRRPNGAHPTRRFLLHSIRDVIW